MMNPSARDIFDRIVKKDRHELTDFEFAFLRARESYMTDEQRQKYFGGDELLILQKKAKERGIKGAHLYKDVEKLKSLLQ